MAGEDELFQMELNLHPNEASGLEEIRDEELLGEHGWDLGFWACLDEGEIEDCVAAIGHRRGFVARFRETDVGHITEDPAMELDVSRRSFALHRLINDALEESGPELIPLGKQSHKALIAATIERGEKENKKWAGLVCEDDYPINIEGAAFRENTLLLGLRFPTTAEGRPILVELEGIDSLFDPDGALPEVRGFWTADAVGKGGEMAGVRDLALLGTGEGEELHLVTGNVDSRDKQSVLIQDYPGGRETVATHFHCVLPEDAHSASLTAEFVREFPSLPRVEGMSVTPEGRTYYVTDEDEGVHLRLTRLLVG